MSFRIAPLYKLSPHSCTGLAILSVFRNEIVYIVDIHLLSFALHKVIYPLLQLFCAHVDLDEGFVYAWLRGGW